MWKIAQNIVKDVQLEAQNAAIQKQLDAKSKAERYNAAIMRQRAETVQSVYGQREQQQRARSRIILGEQRAASGEAGVGVGGSTADMERQSQVLAELDALNIRYGGQIISRDLETQAGLDEWKAQVYDQDKAQVRKNIWLGKLGIWLGGAGDYGQGDMGGGGGSTSGGSTSGGYNQDAGIGGMGTMA